MSRPSASSQRRGCAGLARSNRLGPGASRTTAITFHQRRAGQSKVTLREATSKLSMLLRLGVRGL